jgi:arsenite/tail-anchored protein-transporting ATPase
MVFEHNTASNLSEWRTTTLAECTLEAFGPVLLLSIQRHRQSARWLHFSHPELIRFLASSMSDVDDKEVLVVAEWFHVSIFLCITLWRYGNDRRPKQDFFRSISFAFLRHHYIPRRPIFIHALHTSTKQANMSLDSLLNSAAGTAAGNYHDDLKFVFVGGKGGVGKSTTSSAIATLLATVCQKRVLLISTDPAHSLGDAWRQKFSNVPTSITNLAIKEDEEGENGIDGDSTRRGSLDIMEVDPQQSLQGELKQWAAVSEEFFATSSSSSASTNGDDGSSSSQNSEWSSKMNQFQEWLSGIPGIDEATALSTAITHIESGQYDVIVFDTAPTGHTLKLLALPEILEQGIDKLQSWQATVWGYWEALKTAASTGVGKVSKRANIKDQVKAKLTQYKLDIQKVALMLQDQTRTRFVVVCIAEFLSISETQRLLQELRKKNVVASHIVVNQLVIPNALDADDLARLESLAEVGNLQLPVDLLQKTVHACRLSTARKAIQERYLTELKNYAETQSLLDGICEVPLLAEEVTGTEAIRRFAKLLIKDPICSSTSTNRQVEGSSGKLYDDLIAAKNAAATKIKDDASFAPNDIVKVVGLTKSPQFNNVEGKVTTYKNDETGRYGVSIQYQGKAKTLALQSKNMAMVMRNSSDHGSSKKHKVDNDDTRTSAKKATADWSGTTDAGSDVIIDKAKKILDDPEIKQMVEQNPRFKAAVQDCLANPMNVLQYLGDAEMSPLISKAMAKMGAM